jgi:hypothetical protein
MTYPGTIQNGVVVLAGGVRLPEGTQVTVAPIGGPSEQLHAGEKTIWQKMIDLAEWVEAQPCNLPDDLADNHDHYLHGLPKQ